MPIPLYTLCSLCGGTRLTLSPMTVTTSTGPALKPAGTECLCLRSPTPGLSPVGLTVAQVERLVELRAACGPVVSWLARQYPAADGWADDLKLGTNAEGDGPDPHAPTAGQVRRLAALLGP